MELEFDGDDIIEEQDQMPVDEEETNEVNEVVGSSRSVFSSATESRQHTTLNSVTSTDDFGYVLVMDNIR